MDMFGGQQNKVEEDPQKVMVAEIKHMRELIARLVEDVERIKEDVNKIYRGIGK